MIKLHETEMLKKLFIYGTGNVLTYAIPIVLIPILTRTLTPYDYGIISIFTAVYKVMNIFIGLSGSGAVVRAYMDKDDIGFDFSAYLSNALVVNSILFSFALFPFFVMYKLQYIKLPAVAIYILPLIVVISNIKGYKHKLWNIQEKAVPYALFLLLFTLSSLGLAVLFVLTILPDWRARVYSIGIAESIFCIISIYYLIKEDGLKFELRKDYILDVIKYGVPIIPHSIGLTLLSTSDKLLISNLSGLSDVGVYSIATAIATLVMLVAMPIDQAFTPRILHILKRPTLLGRQRYVLGFLIYTLALSLSGFVLYLISPIAIHIFVGEQFQGAAKFVGILIIGQVAHGMYRYVAKPVFFSKKTYLISLSTISSGTVAVATQYILIKSYGVIGAAVGTSLSYVLSFLFISFFSQRLYPMPWRTLPSLVFNYKRLLEKEVV